MINIACSSKILSEGSRPHHWGRQGGQRSSRVTWETERGRKVGKNFYCGFYREKEHVRQGKADLGWASLNHFRWLWDTGAAPCCLAPGSVGDKGRRAGA